MCELCCNCERQVLSPSVPTRWEATSSLFVCSHIWLTWSSCFVNQGFLSCFWFSVSLPVTADITLLVLFHLLLADLPSVLKCVSSSFAFSWTVFQPYLSGLACWICLHVFGLIIWFWPSPDSTSCKLCSICSVLHLVLGCVPAVCGLHEQTLRHAKIM